MSAKELVGDEDDFLFLARDEVVVDHELDVVWRAVEGDRHDALLHRLSKRYAGRVVEEELADGYRCTTSSKAPLRRSRSYDSIVWLDPPDRSVELQLGRRTDLRYELAYSVVEGGTCVRCTQWYRAHTTAFESGPAIAQIQQRAAEVVAARVAAIRSLLDEEP